MPELPESTVEPGEKIRLLMKLRQSGVTDSRVLGAIEQVPREMFVPLTFRDRAYEDAALPIEVGQTISQPSVVAWMTWALETNDRLRVLEVGTGSGYQAAVLSKLCRMVYTIERHESLYEIAKQRFDAMGLTNIVNKRGDGYKGWPHGAPFDRIIITAAAPEVPNALLEQLAPGGVMVIPVGAQSNTQVLLRISKDEAGNLTTKHLMDVRFVPMVEG